MPDDLHSHISAMISQAARAKSGDELLLMSIEQVLRSAKPNQAEVLRRVAVPRWVDVSVLRILREGVEIRKPDEEVLELLRSYSFVRDLGDGRVAYHDQVREALREEWFVSRPAELRALHRRLYQYFSERTTPPGSNRRAVPLVPDSTTLSAVPHSAQADLFRREAIYHLLQADPAEGMAELRAAFDELKSVHRLAEADLLLQAAADAPVGEADRLWVRYMRARLMQAGLSLTPAAATLDAIQGDPALDPDLAAEVGRARGEIYAETGQWAIATDLYRDSLAHFRRRGDRRAAAETMLLLGEAYQALGVSTGSWHVPTAAPNAALQLLHALWIWLLGLPFRIATLALGPKRHLLPLPEYCARYQNWLLIRLYNTARGWFEQARDAFAALKDEPGTLRAEQRLADILLLYGYHREARAAVERLLRRPAAADPYRRAGLERSLADSHLAAGDIGSAQVLLAGALEVFQRVNDVRGEASIRTLQGRAAQLAGNVEGAFAGYRDSLDRYRALGYAAARERILHELRAWQRQPGTNAALRERIGAVVAAEPEKRYVGRFIRSALPVLQIASLLALPLALLMLAVVVPATELRALGEVGGVLTVDATFSPLRSTLVLLALIPIYLLAYATIALALIYTLPLSAIEREQPDVIITRPGAIARYDSRGRLEHEMPWAEVGRWLALDRCLWERPLPLYSRTYLEDGPGYDLEIDGITGWYGELQQDIARRLEAAGSAVRRVDLGYRLLNSKMGAAAVLGGLLLLLFTAAENGWLPALRLLPAPLYAGLAFLSFSGALILVPLAYWIGNRPMKLQRALLLNEGWPFLLAVLGALPVAAYLLTGGNFIPEVKALNYGIFAWGAYMLAEAVAAIVAPDRRPVRLALVALATLGAAAVIALPAYGSYQWLVAYTAKVQVTSAPASATAAAAASCGAAEQARDLGADTFTSYLFQGDCAAGLASGAAQRGDLAAARGYWAQAAAFYGTALEWASTPSERVLALYNLSRANEAAGLSAGAGEAGDAPDAMADYLQICATEAQARPICTQIFSQR